MVAELPQYIILNLYYFTFRTKRYRGAHQGTHTTVTFNNVLASMLLSDTIIYRRGRRQHSFKRLRTFKPTLHVFTEQCTQDFSPTENNVTGEETCSHQKNVENVEEQGDQVRTANERANNFAADVLLARLEERFNMDGAAQMSEVVRVGAINECGKRR